MFTSVLVANRGEIAVRVIGTLRRMGIRSVVVASIPDRRSLAVRSADASVLLEGYSAAETYLDAEAIIAAAKAEGCEAIHPGYGFLSERPEFAETCAAAGLVFIGPPPGVLRALGDKVAARKLAVDNDVPVIPGWDGPDDDETLIHQATRIGFPVMIKARGGGGGRGMREVHDPHVMGEALESARREAEAAFGEPGLFMEKLVTEAHHVEVQVVADGYGNVIHLGERDCSVQRRHQKLIEETPSPVVDEALRAELTGAALKLARAIGYVNAGTFEFLVGPPASAPRPGSGRRRADVAAGRPFYFLEVNPRLQVEHPVTEMVTGLDLVELQLRIAAGAPLSLRQDYVKFEGHAIEFRINAEDPWNDFKPSSGRIAEENLRCAQHRTDSGYELGDVVPLRYDSLLAKVIVSAPTRAEAVEDAESALGGRSLFGVPSNLGLHRAILKAPAFREGCTPVDWLERNLPELLSSGRTELHLWVAGTAALVARAGQVSWLGPGSLVLWLTDGNETREIVVERAAGGKLACRVGGESFTAQVELWHADHARVRVAGLTTVAHAYMQDGRSVSLWTNDDEREYWELRVVQPPPLPRGGHAEGEGPTAVVAPLAGTIAVMKVAEGDAVELGDLLLVLEAMKMEHRIVAPAGGEVKAVRVRAGDVVSEGDLLVELE